MARVPRFLIKSESESRCYHVICRVTKQEYWLKDRRVKDTLRKQLWACALFSGVEVMAYCWMSNHIHLLIRVPASVDHLVDEELLQRINGLYGPDSLWATRARVTLKQNGPEAIALRTQFLSRMHDLSEFMRTWKQRFAIWHNKTYKKIGTLWAGRFKSLWVQDVPHVLRSVATYIHLNPLRAGLVENAKDYYGSLWGDCFCDDTELRDGARGVVCRLFGTECWKQACTIQTRYFKGGTSEVCADFRRTLKAHLSKKSQSESPVSSMSRGNFIGSESFVANQITLARLK